MKWHVTLPWKFLASCNTQLPKATHQPQLIMARRSAPPNSGPAYLSPYANPSAGRRQIQDPNESGLSRFMREQILAPEKMAGNISILTGVGVFIGGIVVSRTMGDLLVSMVPIA